MSMRKGLTVLLLLLLPAWAWAGELGDHQVEGFLTSMQELQANERYLEALARAYNSEDPEPMHPGSLLVSEMVALLGPDAVTDMVEPVIRRHGFSGPDEWARIGDRIVLAVLSAEMGTAAPEMARQIDQLRHKTLQSEQLSDRQKARMKAIIEESSQLIDRVMAVPEGDREAVKPWMEELKGVLAYGR